jgi:protein-L-isoaspartate(D-aspartate) O-methyltransferase
MATASPSVATPDFAGLRRTMVDCQIRTFDVTNQVLLSKFLEVPREIFVPDEVAGLAYSDATLKLKLAGSEESQRCLLPPLILARLLQAAEPTAADKILDVAPGTGYSTGIFCSLGADVSALESAPSLADAIPANLAKLQLKPAACTAGSLSAGLPGTAPFDLIFINGAVETNLDTLFAQLKDGGRLVTIKVDASAPGTVKPSHAVRFEKTNGSIGMRTLFDASAPVLAAFRSGVKFVF